MRLLARHALRRSAALLALPFAAAVAGAQATVLDFEDLGYHTPGAPVRWPGGDLVDVYGGLTWTSFRPLDLRNYPLYRPDPDPAATGRAGYPRAPRFGNVLGLAFGDVHLRAAEPARLFRVDDGLFGSGWTDPVALTVTGFRAGSALFTRRYELRATTTAFLDLPDDLLDELLLSPDFTPPGFADPYGSAAANGGSPFQTFWLDNLGVTLASVPEPGSLALLAGGLAGVAGVAARRRRGRRAGG